MWVDPWEVLELDEETADLKSVKKAYARKLKTIDIEANQEAFIRLRSAYETAISWLPEEEESPRKSFRDVTLTGLPEGTTASEDKYFRELTQTSMNQDPANTLQSEHENATGQDSPSPILSFEDVDKLLEEVSAVDETPEHEVKGAEQRSIEHLIEDAEKHLEGPLKTFDLEVWRKIFWAPELEPLDATMEFENFFVDNIAEITGWGEREQPGWPKDATEEFASLIDERFGWLSDGVTFQRRYGSQAEWVQRALMNAGARTARRARDGAGFRYLGEPAERLPTLLKWGSVIVIYFLARALGLPAFF